jgi:hypothetical protein
MRTMPPDPRSRAAARYIREALQTLAAIARDAKASDELREQAVESLLQREALLRAVFGLPVAGRWEH